MHKHYSLPFIYAVLLSSVIFCNFAAPIHAQGVRLQLASAVSFQNIEQLVAEKWTPQQHLYVKGDLQISDDQLSNLESWLDQNGSNWTVVLMNNAEGERYRSLDNRSFSGMDAVEYALGRGLALRTNFSDIVDPRTGETSGAVFVLFLRERKFSYYASVAQDVRGLGESHWFGELDRPAFRAMKGGGRIIDAVRDTITNIGTRLTQKIAAEAEQAERQQKARQRAYLHLKTDIAELRKSIALADAKADALKQQYAEASGELTSPPTETWRRQLQEVEGSLTEDNVAKSSDEFMKVSHAIEGYLNSYAEYETYDEAVAPVEAGIAELMSAKLKVGRPMAKQATQHLDEAVSARNQGDRGIASHIARASDQVSQGRSAIVAEQERIRREEARKNLIWKTILATIALVAVALVATLAWLNRRRLPAMERAQKSFAEQEQTVKEEMDRVYGLFERSNEILGSKEKVEKRGYEGITKKLTDNTFEDIDDLFVMSSEVERVMKEASEMIHPSTISGKLTNMFSSEKFEQGVNRISGEPLQFHRNKGLPLVIQRESERTGAEPPEEVTMTFDKVFQAFNERTATAENTLNTVENSLLQVDDDLKKLQEQIETASKIDRELAEAANDDGFFALPAVFEVLIPSAQADFDKADESAGVDPVQAVQVQIPSGSRKMLDALSISTTVQRARKDIFPKMNEFAPQLKAMDYSTEWMQQSVASLGETAEQLAQRAVDHSVADEANQFANDVTGLGTRVQCTVELAHQLKDAAGPAMQDLSESISQARSKIAATLHLAEVRCLNEHEANPDLELATARELSAAAQAALQHGGVEAAEQALAKLDAAVKTGHSQIDRSLKILGDFDSDLLQRRQDYNAVADKLPRHEQLLETIRRDYAPSALVLQAGDSSYEDSTATVETHLASCHASLQSSFELMDHANQKFKSGQLLEADDMLALAEGHMQETDLRLTEIDQHCSLLNKTSRMNEGKLSNMQRDAVSLNSKVSDNRTMRPTIADYQRIMQEIETAQREIQQTRPRDPFQDDGAIDQFQEHIRRLGAKIAADHDAHAEASRAVEGAKKERTVAQRLIDRARQDGIPDSTETTSSIQRLQSYDPKIAHVESELRGQHNDWKIVDQTAARIHSELGVEAGRLRGELDRAQRLVQSFQSASDAVFEATRWTGGFGIRIFGSPGSHELERARQALNQGNYAAMAELARAAQIAAQHAIQRAQREVYRKQREAARREEQARRQRRQNSIHIGGGGGMSSGGRRSSSNSRSSSPSGSGFSRSGW